jgi:hypothetical protein
MTWAGAAPALAKNISGMRASRPMDLVLVGVKVQAEQPDRACVRPPEPDGAFDGGGFPGPVRPQDAEDLTLGHRD